MHAHKSKPKGGRFTSVTHHPHPCFLCLSFGPPFQELLPSRQHRTRLACHVQAATAPSPPLLAPLPRLRPPPLRRRRGHRRRLPPSLHPDGLFRRRRQPVPAGQPVRGRGGGDMGQRRRLRAAVPGEVPQLLRAPGLPRRPPNHPDQGRRPGFHLGLAAGDLPHHPGALPRRVQGHHQLLCRRDRDHQRRVPAGLNRGVKETQPEKEEQENLNLSGNLQ